MIFITAFLRHLAPVVAVWISSPEVKTQVAAVVASALAYGWSVLEKQVQKDK